MSSRVLSCLEGAVPQAWSRSGKTLVRPYNRPDMAEKLIAENRRARHDYQLLDRFEAGLVLTGTEVKSLRDGRATLGQAWAEIRDGEAWLQGLEIATYAQG